MKVKQLYATPLGSIVIDFEGDSYAVICLATANKIIGDAPLIDEIERDSEYLADTGRLAGLSAIESAEGPKSTWKPVDGEGAINFLKQAREAIQEIVNNVQ